MAKKKRGRKAEVLKVEGDWEAAVAAALRKRRPDDGWPTPEKPAKAKKKRKRKKT